MKIDIEKEPKTISTGAAKDPAAHMEAKINKLKGCFEERKARSHTAAHWEGMIEDCEVILDYLETSKR